MKEPLERPSAHRVSGSPVMSPHSSVLELREASEQTQSKFKSEKQSRRQLELKVTSLEEELTDLRAEKESLEKVSSKSQVLLGAKWPGIAD